MLELLLALNHSSARCASFGTSSAARSRKRGFTGRTSAALSQCRPAIFQTSQLRRSSEHCVRLSVGPTKALRASVLRRAVSQLSKPAPSVTCSKLLSCYALWPECRSRRLELTIQMPLPNPSLQPTCYGWLRQPTQAAELKR